MAYGCRMWASEVAAFKEQWPCHGLNKVYTAWFCFEDNGDLCDYKLYGRNGHLLRGERYDSPALVALSHDAQRKIHPEHLIGRE